MTIIVDARGLPCPTPVIRAALAAQDAEPGTVLEIWWTDPSADNDIPVWARMRGHTVLGSESLADADRETPSSDGGSARVTRIRVGTGGR